MPGGAVRGRPAPDVQTPGEPLPAAVLLPLSAGFGTDLSAVRVHTDGQARKAAGELGARAFTVGTHVYLGPGQQATDLRLVAHEVAHVLQQQGGPMTPLVAGRPQRDPEPGADPLEREAHLAAEAITAGRSFSVAGRTDPRPQGDWVPGFVRRGAAAVGGTVASGARAVGGAVAGGARAVGGAVVSGARAVGGAVAAAGAAVWNRIVGFLRERAVSLPGYDLLAFAVGRDPITQRPVERTAANLLRAVIGLIPGGRALYENLQRAGVVQRAFVWLSAEIGKLGISWAAIRDLLGQVRDSLGASDIVNPGRAWEKLRAIFAPPLGRLRAFAGAVGEKILEFVFEGALALAGGAAQQVLAIFRRIGTAFRHVIRDPVRFIGHLVRAVRGSFRAFAAKIGEHLRTALFGWLLGALRGTLTLPERFDLRGIVSIVLQVLGMTYQRLRGLLVRRLGERPVAYLEGAFDFLRLIVTQGLPAAWNKIVEFASGLAETVIGGIRNWVMRSVVGAAVIRLVSLFNPAGAIIQAVMAVYNTVRFFMERAQQIGALLSSILDSLATIAAGNVSAAVGFIERSMVRALTVILSFLARLLGLGNVTAHIRDIIRRVQAVIDNAIRRVIDFIVTRARTLLARQAPPVAPERSGPVKQKVKDELAPRIRRIDGPRALTTALQTTYRKYRPEGLRALRVVGVRGKPGMYVVKAAASASDDVGTVVVERHLKVDDLDLRYGTRLIAFMNGQSLGVHRATSKTIEGHAEVWLITFLTARWHRFADPTGDNHLLIQITRSPCPDCAGRLDRFVARMRGMGYQLRLELQSASLYRGGKTGAPGAIVSLELMRQRGHTIESWNVLKEVERNFGEGVDPDSLRAAHQKLEPRVRELQAWLDLMTEVRAG